MSIVLQTKRFIYQMHVDRQVDDMMGMKLVYYTSHISLYSRGADAVLCMANRPNKQAFIT